MEYPTEVTIERQNFLDRKSTRLNSSHDQISYAVFCLKKKKKTQHFREGAMETPLTLYHADIELQHELLITIESIADFMTSPCVKYDRYPRTLGTCHIR